MSGFAFSVIIQMKRLLFMIGLRKLDGSLEVITSTIIINVIAFISLALTLTYDDRHCADIFGVVLHPARYIEWIITVPLLGYATVMPISSERWNPADTGVIGSLFLCILCGWVYQMIRVTYIIAVLLFILSFVFFGAAYYFLYLSNTNATSADGTEVLTACAVRTACSVAGYYLLSITYYLLLFPLFSAPAGSFIAIPEDP
jgi:bacteriorhodopsin